MKSNKSRRSLSRIACCLLYFLVAMSINSNVKGQSFVYPAPEGLRPSDAYSVRVDGKEAFVYSSPVPAAYCAFDMSGAVNVTIKANRDIKWVDVRPLTANIKVVFKDSTITLRIEKPVNLSIELNGSLKLPLFLFANAPELNKPSRHSKDLLYFEAGKVHYAGIINLKSNQSVYVEGGAVVVGVVKSKGANKVKIFGRGVLDGSYNNRLNDSLLKSGTTDTALIHNMKGTYHRFLEFIDCKDVTVEGVILHNSTSWQVVPINCDDVFVRDVKIVSDQASDDGIDIVRSRNVLVAGCFIRTKDDCVVIKAHLDYASSVPVDNVLISNCTLWNALWGNAIEIGFELNAAEIRNITFRDIDIIHVEAGAAISIHNAGVGHVRNILFEDIRIEDARQKFLDFAIFRSQYSKDGTRDPEERKRLYLNGAWDGVLAVPTERKDYHANFRGQISDVVVKDVHIVDGLFPYSIFYGSDEKHPVKNVRIENLRVHGRKIQGLEEARIYRENATEISIR